MLAFLASWLLPLTVLVALLYSIYAKLAYAKLTEVDRTTMKKQPDAAVIKGLNIKSAQPDE